MKVKRQNNDDLRPEYDFDYSKASRGKYTNRLTKRSSGSLKNGRFKLRHGIPSGSH